MIHFSTSRNSSKRPLLQDDYFVSRRLYPNVDFYSGIIYRAMGIPTDMFTVMFALGRLPGWMAHWRELHEERRHADQSASADLHGFARTLIRPDFGAIGACATESLSSAAKIQPQASCARSAGAEDISRESSREPAVNRLVPESEDSMNHANGNRRNARIQTPPTPRFLWRRPSGFRSPVMAVQPSGDDFMMITPVRCVLWSWLALALIASGLSGQSSLGTQPGRSALNSAGSAAISPDGRLGRLHASGAARPR